MIVTFFRSSSYNAWDICNHKYFLDYTLGFRSPANKKADKGNVVHKALELMSLVKLAKQNKKTEFEDAELGIFNINTCTPEHALNLSYKYYKDISPNTNWNDNDIVDCRQWMTDAMSYNGGMFNPLNRNIVSPEQYFEFTIEQPWAEYSYTLPDGQKLRGHLGIKGSMDLITKVGDKIYELIDWKTGERKNWATGEEKTYDKLRSDPQLRIYHYAASLLYPDVDQIIVTIFYVRCGGPISLCFTKKDIIATEKMLKKRFDVIRNTVKPKLVYPSMKCNWCWFKKNGFDGPVTDFSKSICQEVKRDVVQLGIDKVMLKHGKPGAFNSYGSGGGKQERGVTNGKSGT